jgi:MFS family permease
MTVGLLLSGLYTDYLGRKHMLSISMFSTFIFVVWHAYAYHYVEVFILRFAFGFF